MSGREHRSRGLAPSLGRLLLLALTVLGLFAMHGLQTTASPVDTPSVAIAMPGMSHPDTDAAHHMTAPTPQNSPHHQHPASPSHKHPGGQVCLALLVMAALLILYAVFVGRQKPFPAMSDLVGRGHDHQSRAPPPPSIFQLSVLRL